MAGSLLKYKDDVILVTEKPAGLLCVPGRGPEKADCHYSRLLETYPDLLVVHRLDQATSGLMIWALTKEAQSQLGRQFENRLVKKSYQALVEGVPSEKEGRIVLKQRLDPDNRPMQVVDPELGKKGITRWELVEEVSPGISRINLYPETGRTHQLRLHMAQEGTPIVGDTLYGSGKPTVYGRMCLHACTLKILHPLSGKEMTFSSPVPF